MSRAKLIDAMYDMVSDMTITNGFNYDWIVVYDGDKSKGKIGNSQITISLGTENNEDDIGGNGSAQYIDSVEATITGKVNIEGADIRGYEIPYKMELALSKALDDIKTRYDSYRALCLRGVACRGLNYISSEPVQKPQEGKYRQVRIECKYEDRYITERIFIDG